MRPGGAIRSASAATTSVRVVMVASFAKVFGDRSGCVGALGLARVFFDLEPASGALRVSAAIRGADLSEVCRERSDARNLDPGDDVLDLFVADRSSAGPDNKAGQSLRVRRRVVERDEAAAGDADEVESREPEMIRERVQIVRRMPGLWSGCRIG